MQPVQLPQPAAPSVQGLLALARPLANRQRSVRRPFNPSREGRGYRLPHDVRERLTTALAPFRNRDSAYALAVFLARFWSVPGRIALGFPIDRRELADRPDLGLTEDRVRGAIKTLEAVSFLERAIPPAGSAYKATPDGLHRKPISYVFGADYGPAFIAANNRAAAARGGVAGQRRPLPPEAGRRPSAPVFLNPNSPKTSVAEKKVLMGETRIGLPAQPSAPTALDLALQRLGQAIGLADGGSQNHRDPFGASQE